MREIKFRGWHIKEKQYTYDIQKTQTFYHDFETFLTDKNVIVEQFTGLKDKNGVEIYEGDVVRRYVDIYPNGAFYGDEYYEGYYEGKIKFYRTKGFILECYKRYEINNEVEEKVRTQLHLTTNTLEVIGNIHDKEVI